MSVAGDISFSTCFSLHLFGWLGEEGNDKSNRCHRDSAIVAGTIAIQESLGINLATIISSDRVRDDSKNYYTQYCTTDIEEHLFREQSVSINK